MIKYYWTRYLFSYPRVLLYMLQNTEYRLGRYLSWYHRTNDFRRVMKRRELELTTKVALLFFILRALNLALGIAFAAAIYLAVMVDWLWWFAAAGIFIAGPWILAYGIVIPLAIGWLFIQKPREQAIIRRATQRLKDHPAKRIAVAGSFGKTTAKEILAATLSEGVKVAMTPGNMNTAIGISRFVAKLNGDEEVLIFELGEEKVGDVRRLARMVRPDVGIITGINEAHLQSFKSLDRTVGAIFELADFVEPEQLYKNRESELVEKHKAGGIWFDRHAVGNWKVKNTSTDIDGTAFAMTRGEVTINAHTSLIGLQTVGVTAAAVAIADSLGLNVKQIEAGLQKVRPFEHRMEPRPLHGAWIIDDTYNGNSEGVKAGLEFLKHVTAKRRIYVTPGLVEQGDRTQIVHEAIGEQAARSADVVVLMQNSVTNFIKTGLEKGKFKGELLVIDDPLEYYTNLEHFVAAGDVVLMQNDWTDNYA